MVLAYTNTVSFEYSFSTFIDEHRVQRYGDDHPELIEGESESASASPKIKGKDTSNQAV